MCNARELEEKKQSKKFHNEYKSDTNCEGQFL